MSSPTLVLSPKSPSSAEVALALRCTRKGRLTYDRDWLSRSSSVERVLKEVTEDLIHVRIDENKTEDTPKTRKKRGSLMAEKDNRDLKQNLTNGNSTSNVELPKCDDTKSANDCRYEQRDFHHLPPLQITVDRRGERNIINPKHITLNCDIGLDNKKIIREARVDIQKLKLPQSFKDINRVGKLVAEKRFYNEVKYVERHYGNEKDSGNNISKDYLTCDNDEESSETSDIENAKTEPRPENDCLITKEEEELMSFVLKVKREAEARVEERRKRWEQDLQEVLVKSRGELETSIQEASRQEELEIMKMKEEREEAERIEKEKLKMEKEEREQRQRELEEMVKHAETKKAEDMKRLEKLKKDQELLARIETRLKTRSEILVTTWKNAKTTITFSKEITSSVGIVHEVDKVIVSLRKLVNDGLVTGGHWKLAEDLDKRMATVITDVENDIKKHQEERRHAEEAAAVAAATEAKRRDEEAAKIAAEAAAAAIAPPTPVAASPDVINSQRVAPATTTVLVPPPHSRSSSLSIILDYKRQYVSQLTFADSDRSFQFQLQKAVNTPLNAVSASTSAHLRDKLEKLRALLAGEVVSVGEGQVRASDHPRGVMYCTELVAKKLVRQGEDVVCVKSEAAFPFAAIAVCLWLEFPDFGKLLLAHFYELCPFLAPHHPVQQEGQSDQDYYRQLGYKYDDEGAIEKQDKYLKRMSGLCRLYSAISVTGLPRSSGTVTIHPHSPAVVWTWLANVVNQTPLSDITATLLHTVLEVTGQTMFKTYKAQFLKLIMLLSSEYLALLEKVKVEGGPTVRLEQLLQLAIKMKTIKQPEGVLKPGFL